MAKNNEISMGMVYFWFVILANEQICMHSDVLPARYFNSYFIIYIATGQDGQFNQTDSAMVSSFLGDHQFIVET